MDREIPQTIVIENGSGMMKAGMACQDAPQIQIPTVLAKLQNNTGMLFCFAQDRYVGEEAFDKNRFYSLQYPMKHGQISNWNSMEEIWHHIFFNELRIDPSDHECVVMSEPLFQTKQARERIATVMLEDFVANKLCLANESLLSLFAQGRTTGLVCSSGDSQTYTVPIIDGFVVPHAIRKINFGGADINENLKKMLKEQNVNIKAGPEWALLNKIKGEVFFISKDMEVERKIQQQKKITYFLPDDVQVSIGDERFELPEALFTIKEQEILYNGVQDLVFQSINDCPADIQQNIAASIILSGGNTLLQGMEERLAKETQKLILPLGLVANVIGPPKREHSVWNGGSLLATLSSYQQHILTKEEFEEYGPSLIHRKVL